MTRRQRPGERPVVRRSAGVAFLLVPVLLVWLSVAVYDKDFTAPATVTVETDSIGNEMHLNADVKLHGVVVGQVRQITTDGRGARLTLAIDRGQLSRIPADVRAQMLPTTLFGERFVALVPPAAASPGAALADNAVIPQDRSADAVELEQVFGDLMPLLTAVQPEKLAATLNAVATALQGRGQELGTTLVQLDGYLRKLNPQLPALADDVDKLVTVSQTYAQAAPDLVQALTEFTRTSGTIAEEQGALDTLYGTTTGTAQDLTGFLQANQQNLIRLAVDSAGTLTTLGRYAPEFPCTLRALAAFVPVMDKVLGAGTNQPGLHVKVVAVPSRGRYLPGGDTPVYDAGGGPHCYGAPDTSRTAVPDTRSASALGLPNSPQENELVAELLTPGTQAAAPAAPAASGTAAGLPDWSSLLAGPLLRGNEVTLR